MALGSNEHYEIIAMFEKEYSNKDLEKYARGFWAVGSVYKDENTNDLFLAYRRGVALGKVL